MKSACILTLSLAASGSAMPHMNRQVLGFDPRTQAVSVSGEHAWQAPGPNDLRGPCPAMNSMANHGYIPRNGFVSSTQAIRAMDEVFGVSTDLGILFAVLNAVVAGDGFSFSIGGPPPPNLIAGGLLGQPRGISHAHNRFEADASITRQDLYISGDAATMHLPFLQGLLEFAGDADEFDLDLMGEYSFVRYNHSLFNNPFFFRGPVGLVIPPATNGLVAHLFANHSAEHPDGYLSRSTLKSFYGVTGPDDDLQFSPGHERIPRDWFKRSPLAPYSTASLAADLTAVYLAHPDTLVFGGNTGTVNSFAGVDLANLTGGVFNTANLLEGNNLACFLFQTLDIFSADIIRNGGVINDLLDQVTGRLRSAIGQAISGLSCPQLAKFDDEQLRIFPGYTEFNPRTGTY